MRESKLDLINLAQWLIAGASLLLLFAIWDREQVRGELEIAQRARNNIELTMLRERDQHRAATDQLLDEINRLKATDEPSDLDTEPAAELGADQQPAAE